MTQKCTNFADIPFEQRRIGNKRLLRDVFGKEANLTPEQELELDKILFEILKSTKEYRSITDEWEVSLQ